MTEQQYRLKIVAWALSYLGAARGDARHKEIIDTYNSFTPRPHGYTMSYSAAWCAAFVSAGAVACELTDIIPVDCSCGSQVEAWKQLGRWKEDDGYVPQIGDVIYYDWHDGGIGDCTGAPDHVGIVTDVTGKRLCIVEGNKGSKSQVATRTIMVNERYIRGYGLPNYASLVKPETCTVTLPVLTQGATGDAVKSLQLLLNRHGAELIVDGSFGPLTAAAVEDFQRRHGLTPDRSVGPATWAAAVTGG